MTVLADINYVEPWWMQILKSLVIFLVVFNFVPVVLMADRKVLGRFQQRYGPNRVGPFGALQPIADILKLLGKEDFRTWNSVAFLHRLAPILSVIAAAGVRRGRAVRPGDVRSSAPRPACTGWTCRSGRCGSSR